MTTVDHIPISMFFNIKGLPELVCNDSHTPSEMLDWARLTDVDLQYYKLLTDVHLRNIELPVDAIMCGNINCKNVSHNNDLCAIYDQIVNCLVDGSEPLRRKVVKQHIVRPGWNDYVHEVHMEDASRRWVLANLGMAQSVSTRYRLTLDSNMLCIL